MRQIPIVYENDIFALLENTRGSSSEANAILFTFPITEICCHDGSKLEDALCKIDQFRSNGLHLCGYIAYEAAYFLADRHDFVFNTQSGNKIPLLHFYAFRDRHDLTLDQATAWLQNLNSSDTPVAIEKLSLNMSKEDYLNRIEQIREYIRDGDSYQVNFTLKYRFAYQGSPTALYRRLRGRQRVEFAALLNFPEFGLLSLSPELFIRKRGNILESKPMKGTWPRGVSADEDRESIAAMKRDPKTLSENVMIVDLIRNDVSRVANIGSVTVENLFEVQTYETLHQMISTVKGRVGVDTPASEIIRQLFPCGSITGAPKIRTMQIIEELEVEHRGIYTGAIGYLTPNNDFCFSVPIRTCIAYRDGTAEMGVGGGILNESDPYAEFDECVLKAKFLTGINSSFRLLESMRYRYATGDIENLDRHLARIQHSASALLFNIDPVILVRELRAAVRGVREDKKVRLTVDCGGSMDISLHTLGDTSNSQQPCYVDISDQIVKREWFLLRHKTTERTMFDREYEKYHEEGAYDVLFLNDAGHITEATRHNVFIEKDGLLITSPVNSGLLGGIARGVFLETHRERCVERPLTPSDLLSADRILLTNSVRGVVQVLLNPKSRSFLLQLAEKVL